MLVLNNTIVARNTANIVSGDIFRAMGTITGNNNLIGNAAGQPLVNNVNSNIVGLTTTQLAGLFVNAATGNYRLAAGSSAIDKGSNNLIPDGITTDLDGNARIVGSAVDIGAYEYGTAP